MSRLSARPRLFLAACAALPLFAALLPAAVSARRITPSDVSFREDDPPPYAEEDRGRRDEDALRRSLLRQQQQKRSAAESGGGRPTSPEDHRVTDLPLLDVLPTDMYAGLLPASEDGHKQLFYWLVAPPVDDARPPPPLLIWLNGGPGCSSMEGLFLENGPLRFVLDGGGGGGDGDGDDAAKRRWKLEPNPHSWHLSPAWVLYVDQPVGTGLSYTTRGDYCGTDEQVDRDFVYFLEEFLLLHGDRFLASSDGGGGGSGPPALSRPLYFSGESHAGHYIPSMIDHILARKDDKEPHRVDLSVAGAAIGNGWTDPYHQYAAAGAAYGSGLISLAQKAYLDGQEKECQEKLDDNNLRSGVCFQLLDGITAVSHGSGAKTVACKYDVSKSLPRAMGSRAFPPGHEAVDAYLGGYGSPSGGEWGAHRQTVLEKLHASESLAAGQRYKGCTDPPYHALAYQDGLGVVQEVVRILEHESNVRLLFYNGMNDLVCNHVGNEVALQKLPWESGREWTLASRYAWHIDPNKAPAGYGQEHRNLMYLKIPHAGHMVPMDQPVVALEMMRTFLSGGSFQGSTQKINSKDPVDQTC